MHTQKTGPRARQTMKFNLVKRFPTIVVTLQTVGKNEVTEGSDFFCQIFFSLVKNNYFNCFPTVICKKGLFFLSWTCKCTQRVFSSEQKNKRVGGWCFAYVDGCDVVPFTYTCMHLVCYSLIVCALFSCSICKAGAHVRKGAPRGKGLKSRGAKNDAFYIAWAHMCNFCAARANFSTLLLLYRSNLNIRFLSFGAANRQLEITPADC
jgi:hypothetical protein